jgi:outer membrane protein assembly factor BamE (lipoprotein component of BamABCDE complex)
MLKINFIEFLLLFVLSVTCFFVTGCATSPEAADKIHEGVTTKKEAIRILGRPDTAHEFSDGTEQLTWFFNYARGLAETTIDEKNKISTISSVNVTINVSKDGLVTRVRKTERILKQ